MEGKGTKMQCKESSSYSKAKVLTLIPVFVLAATVICMVLAAMLEVPTGKGVLYTIFAFAGLIGMLISPFPCLVMSVLGTVFAAKAGKEGIAGARKFLVLGIIEISVHVVGVSFLRIFIGILFRKPSIFIIGYPRKQGSIVIILNIFNRQIVLRICFCKGKDYVRREGLYKSP